MRRLVFPAYTIHSDWSDDGTHIDTATAFLYDGIGNILEEKRYGFVKARLEDATFQDIVGDETITDWTYTSNPQRNLFRFNTSEKMFGFSGELLAESHIEYDHIGDGVERGLMTKKSRKNID